VNLSQRKSPKAAISFWVVICVSIVGIGCNRDKPSSKIKPVPVSSEKLLPSFERVKEFQKLALQYDNGESAGLLAILESLGGGGGLFDYDGDGCLDVCLAGGGRLTPDKVEGLPTRLVRQTSDARWMNVSAQSGINIPHHYSHGVTCGDWNADGFCDIVVTGYGGVTLWENQGDGTFLAGTDQAQLDDDQWSSSAAFADLNQDGFPELYLSHYVDWSLENHPLCNGPSGVPDVCPPRSFEGIKDSLYLNTGDGTFRNISDEVGLTEGGKGLGVIAVDFDNDRDLDLYVANDTVNNFLYLNQGNLQFEEVGLISGVALDHNATANGSMGLSSADYNQDGYFDLFVTNYEEELIALYENQGENQFRHASTQVGFSRIGTLYVGFGCASVDLNEDGLIDFCSSNGHVVHHPRNAPLKQKPLIMLQSEQNEYQECKPGGSDYFSTAHRGRGLATGDVNRDGRWDLLFTHLLEPAALLLNTTVSTTKSLSILLIGTQSDRRGTGGRVTMRVDGIQHLQTLAGGGSYLSSNSAEILFHLDSASPISLSVEWPSGQTDQWEFEDWEALSSSDNARVAIVESDKDGASGGWFLMER